MISGAIDLDEECRVQCHVGGQPGLPHDVDRESALLSWLRPAGVDESVAVSPGLVDQDEPDIPPRVQPQEYRRYRVLAPFGAVIGAVRATGGAVGGGVAYVLPRSVTTLVAGGWIVESWASAGVPVLVPPAPPRERDNTREGAARRFSRTPCPRL